MRLAFHHLNANTHVTSSSLLATSVDVEHIFSSGGLLLSHVHSRLASQSIQVAICLGSWSKQGQVKESDVFAVTILDEVEGDEEPELKEGWYDIV